MLTRVPRIAPSEITPSEVYFNRRTLLAGLLASSASSFLRAAPASTLPAALNYTVNSRYSLTEPANKYEEIAGYNNFYEFGTDKESPSEYAYTLRTRPWTVAVQGEAEVTGTFNLEDLL
jgi:methionine sulfoxide reductase catalytic subunit